MPEIGGNEHNPIGTLLQMPLYIFCLVLPKWPVELIQQWFGKVDHDSRIMSHDMDFDWPA